MIDTIISNYWESEIPELIERHLAIDLKTDLIIDIVGPRRAGKTYLMFAAIKKITAKLDKKATIYINFENGRLLPLKEEYFNQIVDFIYKEKLIEKYKKIYLFLDEVQQIKGWEKYVRSLYDEFKKKIKIVVSGSNVNLLSRDYGKLLTGRHLTVNVLPLSFKEFLDFKHFDLGQQPFSEKKQSQIKQKLKQYLELGGFPEVVLEKNKTKKEELLNQLFSDILARDILSREVTKKFYLLEEFTYFLASNTSNLLSFNKMAKYFNSRGIKISVQTLEHYFNFIKNAFLFFFYSIFSYKIKDQLQYPRKIYCIDTGLTNLIGFKFSKDLGKFYENAVAIELYRRFLSKPALKNFYWKELGDREVDFVVKDKLKTKQLIQVCFNMENEQTKIREIRSLIKAGKELNCNNLLIITEDLEKQKKIQGKTISFIPLWKWLVIE